jgi:hypothetical protein
MNIYRSVRNIEKIGERKLKWNKKKCCFTFIPDNDFAMIYDNNQCKSLGIDEKS